MIGIFKMKVGFLSIFFLLIGSISYGQDYNNQDSVFPQFPSGGFGQNQSPGSSNSSFIDSLPIPSNTKETQGDLGQVYGLNMKMFSSRLSTSELKSFYQNRLSSSGWKAIDTAGMFSASSLGQMNAPAGTAEVAQNSLIFQKGKSILVVAFYPAYGDSQDTVYSITEKQMP